ncbi:MAG: HD-GYP domain-containing protein [Desulfococcaceae bacterium]
MLNSTITLRELIDLFGTILEARDPYTMEHSFRVAEYAGIIARVMGLPSIQVERTIVAAHFHDVGKIGVPDIVLNKTGPLTPEEKRAMQSHSRLGFNILKRIPALEEVSRIVLHHHERYDGMGYPDGRGGEGIPIESRVIAVADAFDAMTSHRHYRYAIPESEAREEIMHHSGSQFCPEVVRHFQRCTRSMPAFRKAGQKVLPHHFAFVGHEDLMHSRMVGGNGRGIEFVPDSKELLSPSPRCVGGSCAVERKA